MWITSVSLKIHFPRNFRAIYAEFLTQEASNVVAIVVMFARVSYGVITHPSRAQIHLSLIKENNNLRGFMRLKFRPKISLNI